MSEAKKIIIDNKGIIAEFAVHLEIVDNKRILFTGPFGAGKSYFLKEFFQENEEYIHLNLFPVDYAVASNEDILELVKYDILNSLLKHYEDDISIQENDFSKFLLIQHYMMHKLNYFEVGKRMLAALIPSASLIDVIQDKSKKLLDSFADHSKQMMADDLDRVVKFIAAEKLKKGSIRESDDVTEMINDFIERIKSRRNGKPFVLVVDDLDRLDPDHIFRLINIFTAHYDSQEETNKFGFDKVILVCDMNSLRYLFSHKYGDQANFNGYIDKFYSINPFVFDNKRFLREKLDELIKGKIKLADNEKVTNSQMTFIRIYNIHSEFYKIFAEIVTDMIEAKVLKIRNFERFRQYALPNKTFTVGRGRDLNHNYFQFLFLYHQLIQFFADSQELKMAFIKIAERFNADYQPQENQGYSEADDFAKSLIKISLPFLVDDTLIFRNNRYTEEQIKNMSVVVLDSNTPIWARFTIDEHDSYWDGGIRYLYSSTEKIIHDKIPRPNPYRFVIDAIDNCERRSII